MKSKQYQARWIPARKFIGSVSPPFQETYPVLLKDGSYLELPLQPFPDGKQAIALLMANQTPFTVVQALTPLLVELVNEFEPGAIVGVPTLGLDYARAVAQSMKFPYYVALGNSRKFWYDDALSMPVVSVTSPDAKKLLYLDPSLVERVASKRTVIVDDVINTGGTATAAIQLLRKAGAIIAGFVVVLTEGDNWKSYLQTVGVDWQQEVRGVGHIPIFQRDEAGWIPIPETLITNPLGK